MKKKKNKHKTWLQTFDATWAQPTIGRKKHGVSHSGYWSDRFESWSWSRGSQVDYEEIRTSVSRSANVVLNTQTSGQETNDEKGLTVRWLTGKESNRTTNDVVYLSADVVTKSVSQRPTWSAEEQTDVLIGEALTEATMKRTIDPAVEKSMVSGDNPRANLVERLWYTAERLAAERDVLQNYPGFNGYFASHRSYYTAKTAQADLQSALKQRETAATALRAIQWLALQPTTKLAMPEKTKGLAEPAARALQQARTSQARADVACEIAAQILKLFPEESTQNLHQDLHALEGNGLPQETRGTVSRVSEGVAHAASLQISGNGSNDLDEWKGGTHEVIVPEGSASAYAALVRSLAPSIAALRARLKIRNESVRTVEHGLTRGRVDEGSLFKLGFHAMGHSERTLFERDEIKAIPSVAILLLVDESGSMRNSKDGVLTRYEHARAMAITLVEALRSIQGVSVAVLGHSGQGPCHGGSADGLVLHHYVTPDRPSCSSLIKIAAFSQNLDGYAIAKAGTKMLQWFPHCPVKILMHLSDGCPAADAYGGASAFQHVVRVTKALGRQGVLVRGLAIDDAYTQQLGDMMYGRGHCVITKDVQSAHVVLGNFVVRTVQSVIADAAEVA